MLMRRAPVWMIGSRASLNYSMPSSAGARSWQTEATGSRTSCLFPPLRRLRTMTCQDLRYLLQDGEKNELLALIHRTSTSPLHQLGYVHDSTYVVAESDDVLATQYKSIAADIFRDRGILLSLKRGDGKADLQYTPSSAEIAASALPTMMAATDIPLCPTGLSNFMMRS